ncbi:MAG TPA: NAD(+) diphosphatase [Pedomonas sp.]|uniref:NAD(+) diphosphatase n=1 Tax=Pedomonas sp. TaxID=2976421 RepID=UPI002F41D574
MSADPFTAPLPEAALGFTGGWLDRTDNLRRDPAWIAEMRQRPDVRWMLLQDLKPVVRVENEQPDLLWFAGADAVPLMSEQDDWVFLGLDEAETPHFAVNLKADARLPEAPQAEVWEARAAAMKMKDARMAVLGQARSLLAWHSTHHFCSKCGTPSAIDKGGYGRRCMAEGCAAEHFPRVDPVAIMLVVDGDSCLVGRQPQFGPGMYSALAGFAEPGESLEEAVRREVWEEAGIRTGRVRYVASQPWPFPSNLMVGCFAEALSRDIRIDETELEDARWFTRAEVRASLKGEGPFTCPPRIAIARHLLETWAALGD